MFTDRTDAGRRLAAQLQRFRDPHVVVLGLPRGGIPVAAEVAALLEAPLDVLVIRKLGAPGHAEYAIGAIGEGGVRVVSADAAHFDVEQLRAVEERERRELIRRSETYRAGREPLDLSGRTALIIDDGIATGSTARAACLVARQLGATHVILAVPVAPVDWRTGFGPEADELIAVATPEPFFAVGQFYASFPQTSDEEVLDCLEKSAAF